MSFVSSQLLFVDEQKCFASSDGARITQRLVRTYPQFSVTAADRASGEFQTRPVVDRAQLVGYEYNAVSHGCPPARFRQVTILNTAAI